MVRTSSAHGTDSDRLDPTNSASGKVPVVTCHNRCAATMVGGTILCWPPVHLRFRVGPGTL